MKLNHLLGAAAACALIAGAAHAGTDTASKAAAAAPATEAAADASAPAPASDTATPSTAAPSDPSATSTGTTTTSDPSTGVSATSATAYGQGASVTTRITSNSPIPDTAENRAQFGKPLSLAGRRTAPKGN